MRTAEANAAYRTARRVIEQISAAQIKRDELGDEEEAKSILAHACRSAQSLPDLVMPQESGTGIEVARLLQLARGGNLSVLPTAIRLCERIMTRIEQNTRAA